MSTTQPLATQVEIRPFSGPEDLDDVHFMLASQLRWLASIGIDPAQVQPDAAGDYADPLGYYVGPDGALLIARIDGRPCGIVGLRRLAGLRGAVELKRMFVLPVARGTGAGRGLLDSAIATARSRGFRQVWLETVPAHMGAAVAMYTAAGFRPAASLGRTDTAGALTMMLDLRPSAPSRRFALAAAAVNAVLFGALLGLGASLDAVAAALGTSRGAPASILSTSLGVVFLAGAVTGRVTDRWPTRRRRLLSHPRFGRL
jgi:GNAT superfamily N-acetyltransferase